VSRRRNAEAGSSVEPAVFLSSAALVLGVLAFGVADPALAKRLFLGLQDRIVSHFGWLFVASTAFFLVFSLWTTLGARGRIVLGPDGEPPSFGLPSWFAMLFSAGMGIGILFYGVAEPVLHYVSPPSGPGGTPEAARQALTLSFFHWGLHAWAVYAVMGLAVAYFGHRRGLPLAVRSTLEPLLGDRIHGLPGHVVDVVAVFGTLFGLATSLGLGAMQINAGLHRLFGAPESMGMQVAVIGVITAAATASVVLGLDRGIRRLSELNVALATGLLLFVVVAGPTAAVLGAFPGLLADYALALVPLSTGRWVPGDPAWQKSWTLFYWAWWIAWSPFVGTFIARISRGRTVREFVLGVLLVPSFVSCVWFTVFGWSALQLDAQGHAVVSAVQTDVATGIYALLDALPFSGPTSLVAALVVAVFFVTSSDSGSFVVDMLTSGGHPDPPVWQRVFWAVSEGLIAAVLLVFGGLAALQSAAINTGLPFCVILLLVCVGLAPALLREGRAAPPKRAVARAALDGSSR
jgi:choline/glycine/proline betaine transport protein